MTRKIWLNSEGKVLVNSEGRPYYTEECCCTSARLFCWVRYEASCIDAGGSPVYGQGGTGNSDTEQWTRPVKAGWSCAEEWPTSLGIVSEWMLRTPGTAYIWLNAGSDCDPEACSSATAAPPPIGIPCSCSPIWGNVAFELPYYEYGVTMIGATPVWQVNGQSGASATRVARAYLANYGHGDLARPQTQINESSNYGSYEVRVWGGTVFHEVPGAGIYVPAGGGLAWVEQGAVRSLGPDFLPSSIGAASAATSTFLSVFRPGWTADFARNNWGRIEIARLDNRGAGDIIMNYVLEARGGSCASGAVHTETGVLGAELPGEPMYHYRCHITTTVPIGDINSGNLAWALRQPDAEHSLATCWAQAAALHCTEYRHMYIAAAWGHCLDDPARPVPFVVNSRGSNLSGAFCAPPSMTSFTAPSDEPYPLPYYADGNMPYDWPTTTYWLHEDDEAVGPGGQPLAVPALRLANASSDGHAYKVVQLSIDNFPTWFKTNLCSGPTGDPEVPALDFTDSAFYCYWCGSGASSCMWPDMSRSLPFMSRPDAYANTWGPVYEVDPIGLGASSRADCGVNEIAWMGGGLTPVVSGSTTTWTAPLDSVYAQSGCPSYGWALWRWVRSTIVKECLVFSGSASKWRDDGTDIYLNINPATYTASHEWGTESAAVGGNMTWQGAVVDPSRCGNSRPSSVSVFTGSVSGQGPVVTDGSRRSALKVEAGLFMYQFPYSVCNSDTHLMHTVGGPNSWTVSAYMSCRLMGASHELCCGSGGDSFCSEYVYLPAGTVITFTVTGAIAGRSNLGRAANRIGTSTEDWGGTRLLSEFTGSSTLAWPFTVDASASLTYTTTLSEGSYLKGFNASASGQGTARVSSAAASTVDQDTHTTMWNVYEDMYTGEEVSTLMSTVRVSNHNDWHVEPAGTATSMTEFVDVGFTRERNAAGCWEFKVIVPGGFVMDAEQHMGLGWPILYGRSYYNSYTSYISRWSAGGFSTAYGGSAVYSGSYSEYWESQYDYDSRPHPPMSGVTYPLFDPMDKVWCGGDAASQFWTNASVCESSNGRLAASASCVVSWNANGTRHSSGSAGPMGEPSEVWDTWDADCYAVTTATVTITLPNQGA